MTGDGRSPGGLILPGSAEFMAFDAPPAPGAHRLTKPKTKPKTRRKPYAGRRGRLRGRIFGPLDRPAGAWPGDDEGPPAPAEHSLDNYLGRPTPTARCCASRPPMASIRPRWPVTALPAAAAVTVAAPTVSDSELGDLADAGCRGLRFQITPESHRLAWTDLDRLAART